MPVPVMRVAPGGAGNAEVADVGIAFVVEQHVRRLQVAMHDAARMRGRQTQRQLARNAQGLVERHWRAFVDARLQRASGDEIHADHPGLAMLDEIVDAHDMRAGHLARQQQLLGGSARRLPAALASSGRSTFRATRTPSCSSMAS
jgi:hypothetical protein